MFVPRTNIAATAREPTAFFMLSSSQVDNTMPMGRNRGRLLRLGKRRKIGNFYAAEFSPEAARTLARTPSNYLSAKEAAAGWRADATNPTGQDGSHAVPVCATGRESFADSSFVMSSEGATHSDN
jgi:hypothetical protein